jgi:putative DNA primase/helicase
MHRGSTAEPSQVGTPLSWVDGKSFRDITPAKLPRAWRKRLRGISGNSDARDSIPLPAGAVAEGSRNNHLASLAGTLQRSGASAEAITAALKAENDAKCVPPLDGSEIKKIVASITKYPAPLADGKDPAETMMQLTLDRNFAAGKHLMLGTDGRFWHFDGRLWCAVTEQLVGGKVLEIVQANPTKGQRTASLVSQTIALLKAKLAVQNDPLSFIANPPPVINCTNGELWIGADGQLELRPHTPSSYQRHSLDVAYDPDAECPEYDKALLEIFSAADDPKAMVRHWNELAGYMIQACRNIPLILILFGHGENGKTKLLETVIRLLGSQLVHAQRIDDLEKNRFMMGSLFGKHLLVDDDVRAGARLPDGILKTISEAKEVTGENKFGPAFNFTVRTVPVLICNNIPSLADLSHGMQRRLMVIPFDRTFSDQDRDRHLFDRIWANELSGVLNRLLAGYRRVLKRNAQFDHSSAVKAATDRLFQQANPLPAFIAECCVKKPKARCLIRVFYEAYVNWTQAMGYSLTQTQQTVARNLEHLQFVSTKRNSGKVILGLDLANPQDSTDGMA